jgi:uncharacterized membrane protein
MTAKDFSRDFSIRSVSLFAVLLLGAAFALAGLDWDEGHHLHPDERFLTIVATALEWPESLSDYFDETKSTLNPRNVGHAFFAYGTFPTTLVKGVSLLTGLSGYNEVYLVGRVISAVSFVGTILFLYLLGRRLYEDWLISLLASFLLATCVLPIQNAHFFTVDSMCVFFLSGAIYWLAMIWKTERLRYFALMGLFFGMALASKLAVATFVLVVLAVAFVLVERRIDGNDRPHSPGKWVAGLRGLLSVIGLFTLSGVVAILTFRICQPDAFSGPGFWGLVPSERWLANMNQARLLVSGEIDTPPGHQWTNRTALWFPWKNMVVWGMGPPLGLTAWIAWLAAAWLLVRHGRASHLIPVLWIGVLFLHQGTQWVKSMRYFLPIYPLLALSAAWFLVRLWEKSRAWLLPDSGSNRGYWRAVQTVVILVPTATFLWACAFTSLYLRPHTRIAASDWIYENISPGSVLANEHWDDPLPLRSKEKNQYERIELEWYDEDTPLKLAQSLTRLDRADTIILSSNRLYDSIPRLPMRYPMTVAYYKSLFDGSLGFEKVAEFTSYPSLFGIDFPDQSAEEAFAVYDHPRVQIFKKTEAYSTAKANAILGNVDWTRIVRLTPKQATVLGEKEIERLREKLSPPEEVRYGRALSRKLPTPEADHSEMQGREGE